MCYNKTMEKNSQSKACGSPWQFWIAQYRPTGATFVARLEDAGIPNWTICGSAERFTDEEFRERWEPIKQIDMNAPKEDERDVTVTLDWFTWSLVKRVFKQQDLHPMMQRSHNLILADILTQLSKQADDDEVVAMLKEEIEELRRNG